jgi:hypothetical protein
MRNRVCLRGVDVSRGEVRAEINRLARRSLPQMLDELLPAVLQGLGLSPQAEIAIRRVRVEVFGEPRGDLDALAKGWARSIGEAIERALSRTSLSQGLTASSQISAPVITEKVAVFANRRAAQLAYLEALGTDEADGWWWPAVLGAGANTPPDPARIIEDWVERSAATASADLLEIAERAPEVLHELRPHDVTHWVERLAGEPVPAAHSHAHRGVPPAQAAPASLETLVERLSRAPQAYLQPFEGRVDLVVLVATCLFARHLPAFRASDVAALVASAARRPSASPERPPQQKKLAPSTGHAADVAGADSGRQRGADSGRQRGADSGEQRGTRAARGGLIDAAKEQHSRDKAWGQRSELSGDRRLVESVELRCAGLLLLLGPLSESELWQIDDPLAFEQAMVDFACLVLQRVLAPLPAAERRAAFEAEEVALKVLAGRRELPDQPWEPVRAPRVEDAVDAITRAVPHDVHFDEAAARALGISPDDFADDETRRLAAVVARSARLELTDTHAELFMPHEAVDIALRRVGWDLDPGWVRRLGRVIYFHYEDRS